MKLKEKALLAILGMVGLYVVAILLWFMTQQAAWKKSAKSYAAACEKYENECELIGEEQKWSDEYENAVKYIKMFDAEDSTKTTWVRKIREISEKHHITIKSYDAKAEKQIKGGVCALPIELSWEGYLESFVKFLHELETTDEGMFAEAALKINPQKDGYLRGSLTLTCSYRKDKNGGEE